MPAGRPLKYKTVEEIKPLIEAYFTNTPKEEWTITGLALALDTSRKTLIDMEGQSDEFSNTIKKAKEQVENSYELDLKKHGRTGTIFALKNFDWRDKQEFDHTTKGEKITNDDKVKELADKLNALHKGGGIGSDGAEASSVDS